MNETFQHISSFISFDSLYLQYYNYIFLQVVLSFCAIVDRQDKTIVHYGMVILIFVDRLHYHNDKARNELDGNSHVKVSQFCTSSLKAYFLYAQR